MAEPTYTIQPNPIWYLVNYLGLPLAPGGFIYTYSSLNPNEPKFAYTDAAGQFPYENPIPIDADGTVGPIYWEYDSDTPDDTYYIRVCKSADPDDLVWDFDGIPNASAGGGGSITTALDLENLIANSVMYRNIGTSVSPVPNFLKVAPGAHTGLAKTDSNRGPDIVFVKNVGSTAIDTISFPEFPLGITPLIGDVTPDCMINYTCTNDPLVDTVKYIQFPITQNVKSLSGQVVTFSMWANLGSSSSANILDLRLKQFFGNGTGPSPEFNIPIATATVSSGWNRLGPYTVTIPSVTGKVVGECHNDGLFLQVGLPLGLACNINFTKPALYLGSISPNQDYHTYDMIESLVNDVRTGDIRMSVNDYQPFGWVAMNDGTIGNPSSGATSRAHFDTFPLYNQIWNSVPNSWAPVTGGRGASSIIDYVANKPIALTRAVGRVFAGTINTTISQTFTTAFAVSTSLLTVASTTGLVTGFPIILSTTGTLPVGLIPNITYYAIVVSATTLRLASSLDNAIAGTAVTFSTNGTGVHTLANASYQLGKYSGFDEYTLQANNLPAHSHPTAAGGQFLTTSRSDFNFSPGGLGATKEDTTGNNPTSNIPISLIQPTTYMNVYIKL